VEAVQLLSRLSGLLAFRLRPRPSLHDVTGPQSPSPRPALFAWPTSGSWSATPLPARLAGMDFGTAMSPLTSPSYGRRHLEARRILSRDLACQCSGRPTAEHNPGLMAAAKWPPT
jgi:hypothetical protein